MWIRTRFDIGVRDLIAGFSYCLTKKSRSPIASEIAETWGRHRNPIVTLSVRSSFDLLLRSLNLPPGSEVLFTALTIPDMVAIAEYHGLKVVPVDIDSQGEICTQSLRSAISSNTRLMVVAHLFGRRNSLASAKRLLQETNILLVEDCAQSFASVESLPSIESDVAMYSFGPIKTATALGGSVVEVRDTSLYQKMQNTLANDGVQKRRDFAFRVLRFAWLKLLTYRAPASLLFFVLDLIGKNADEILSKTGKGFKAGDLIRQIRLQPSYAQMKLLHRRLVTYRQARIRRRASRGHALADRIGMNHSPANTFWAFPVCASKPLALTAALRARGFDATTITRMALVPDTKEHPTPKATAYWESVVFLPWADKLPEAAIHRMADCVNMCEKPSAYPSYALPSDSSC